MDATSDFDVIVVGSGPSGVHAADEAISTGLRVALVDIGYSNTKYDRLIPRRGFSDIRRSDPNQRQYFFGEDRERCFRSQSRAGSHLTPAREHMIQNMDEIFPLSSKSFSPLQSTGMGGLGISWGANCFVLEKPELDQIGLPADEMRDYYIETAKHVGVSGRMDDALSSRIAHLDPDVVQPPLQLDSNAETLMSRYQRKQEQFLSQGFYLGQSLLAVLSQPAGAREANAYWDMDFWGDVGRSVYRPHFTLEHIAQKENFVHLPGLLALSFYESQGFATLVCREINGGNLRRLTGRKLLLAAGALNSGKLALASAEDCFTRLPLLCNPNHWIAAINLFMLGRRARDERHSLSQLTALMETGSAGRGYVLAQFYSYRSLLFSRLLASMPLPPKLGLHFLRLTGTALTMINVHFPDWPSEQRWIKLRQDGSLEAECSWAKEETTWLRQQERRILRHVLQLGCAPLSIARPKHGASIHYAGTLPYSSDERPFTTDRNGRLHGRRRVYVADASSWRFMPAKGLTFTLMANARRVARKALTDL